VGTDTERYDAIVVGAGFSGLYALHRLRGLGLSVRVLEAGDGVGGTWYWNRYPGARCDVESLEYSYSFSEELQQEWSWSERYPAQAEVLRYLEHVADRFGLWPDIQLRTRVVEAAYDEESGRWAIGTEAGERLSAQWCVMATGCLSASQIPAIPGLERFAGEWYHTARWPHEGVDVTGRRVGVIGTGSTGIQIIPEVARDAAHTYVFQRTANFSVPNANRPLDPEVERSWKERYAEQREVQRRSLLGVAIAPGEHSALELSDEEVRRTLQQRWEQGGGMPVLLSFRDFLVDERANAKAAEFVRSKIRETVRDPAVAELLVPRDYPIGAKRLCQDEGYFETFNRDDVTLVDIRSTPIEEITPSGIRTAADAYELDVIVFATGFDALTGALLAIDIRGRDGLTLTEAWAGGPSAYLGLAVAGFPNLFTVTGPGSPSVLSNMVVSIEQHVDWIADCIAALRDRDVGRIEATSEAQEAWMEHVAEVGASTLFPRAASWYVGANVPGKPRVFMPYVGGVGPYRDRCAQVAADGYAGFTLDAAPAGAAR
jgi:cation diffusion facilitator CzcD-associated flavoprotein CzcO